MHGEVKCWVCIAINGHYIFIFNLFSLQLNACFFICAPEMGCAAKIRTAHLIVRLLCGFIL